ncbi:MAG TPA: GNAT family N-acetyltransferase [Acidimicrobiia bacterium]|nr:GNAT family N-acetyltransferase [Acidimicrobiia bacterium]
MEVTLRPAQPDDVDLVAPLVYSSGPDAFRYVFGDAEPFLRRAFLDGQGEFGYRNHIVAVAAGQVVGVGAGYTGEAALAFTLSAARQIARHYKMAAPGVIARGLRTERVIEPPGRDVQYLAHLGVEPTMQGRGVGTILVEHLIELGRSAALARAELDVAVTNPRAQALYERIGFRVIEERQSSLGNEHGKVVNHRRMVLDL